MEATAIFVNLMQGSAQKDVIGGFPGARRYLGNNQSASNIAFPACQLL